MLKRTGSESERQRDIALSTVVVVLQVGAAIYFLADAFDEAVWRESESLTRLLFEVMVGLALIAGVLVSARQLRRLHAEAGRRDDALRIARGAVAAVMRENFAGWGLTAAEAEVATFAVKGFTAAEIAALRGAAAGTVRSQLSQIYGKAGVSSQSMLMALLLEELVDAPQAEVGARTVPF